MNYNVLVERNYSNLLNIAKFITGCSDKAHDLMNDTYIHLLEKSVKIENNSEFVKYYRVCMKNLWLDTFKKKSLVFVDVENIELKEEQNTLIDELELFKKNLPLHERYLYELYFEEGLSGNKISKLLKENGDNISAPYIEKMILNIKLKLRAKKWS